MGEWIMGTTLGDYIGTTIGIHSPIPYKEPDSLMKCRGQGVIGPWERFYGKPSQFLSQLGSWIEGLVPKRVTAYGSCR